MARTYYIRPITSNLIIEREETTAKGKTISKFEILGGTLSNICNTVQIRPRAADFARRSRIGVYAVFHEFKGEMQCLFLFRSVPCNSGDTLEICRCLGKRAVKRHWEGIDLVCMTRAETVLIKKISST